MQTISKAVGYRKAKWLQKSLLSKSKKFGYKQCKFVNKMQFASFENTLLTNKALVGCLQKIG